MARHPVVVCGALILILLGASLFPASAQSGSLVTSHLSGESAAIAVSEANGGAIRFTTEARIGRLFDWELATRRHPSILNDGSLVTTHYDLWLNSIPVPFILTYDGHGTVRMTLLLSTVATRHTVAGDFNELFLATRAVNAGSRIVVDNLVLDGRPVGNSSSAINTGTEVQDVLRIQGGNLADGFILTGRITMAWTGTRPVNSQLDFKLWGAKVVAAPSDTTPPAVAITAPAAGSVLATATPEVTASFSDAGSEIDTASVRLLLDGQDRTGEATVSASGLSFTPPSPLADGPHVAEVVVRDRAGNEGRASAGFTTDTVAPVLAFTSPPATVRGDPTPSIVATYSDATSGLDPGTLQISLDGASLLPGCAVGGSSATCEPQPLGEGSHTANATIQDRAGHTATATLTFKVVLDLNPPSIVLTAPAGGIFVNTPEILVTGTVTDDGQVSSVAVNDVEVPLNGGSFQTTVTLQEGFNEIFVSATDASGKRRVATRGVTLDLTPPSLSVETPAPEQPTNQGEVRVAGAATDENGLASLTVQQVPVPVVDSQFETEVAVALGANQISVRALDRAGNETLATLSVTRFDLPEVAVTSPEDLSFLTMTTVDVSGTVSDPGATVTVNGVAALVSGSTSGTTFLAREVPLIEGGNILTATVTDANGHVSTDSINVVRDRTAPRLAIRYPRNGATLFEPTVTVSGLVNDIVAGTVNASEATVRVNGRLAQVANRSFFVEGVPLSPGDNVLTAEAVDASGNLGQTSITVHLGAANVPRITMVSGNHQEAVISTVLPAPLTVSLLDATGQPVAGKPVLFKLQGNNGSLDGGKRQIAVTTDAAGRASAHFTLGTRAGVGSQVVEATSPGFQGSAVFVATARPGEPAFLVVDSGDQQVGIAGQDLPRPLVAVVTDAGHNRLEGAAVKLSVVEGRGHFANGLQEAVAFSDSDGRVIFTLTLDPEEGVANNVAQARIEGSDLNLLASFAASGRAAGIPAATSVSGVVLDNASLPIAGVTLRILDTPLTAQTDEKGVFRISGAPVGTVKLLVDGSTADRPGSWPDLEFVLTTIPGRDNTVNMPIYLLPLDLRSGLAVDETHGGTLTLPEIPGFALEILPGSVTFPGGSRSGVVSVTAVHSDKVPMVPNFGQQPRFIVTIQPAGARFEPPARLTLPNLEGLAPGEVTEMYSFDHDLGHFVSIGPATVSEDGTVIVSNPGVGIIKAGWHCGGNPPADGATHNCKECYKCLEDRCAPEDLCKACSPAGKACDGKGHCRAGKDLTSNPQVCKGLGIVTDPPVQGKCSGVPDLRGIDNLCGAAMAVIYRKVTHKCDGIDLEGAVLREEVTPDDTGCGAGPIQEGGCNVLRGNLLAPEGSRCTDYYYICQDADSWPTDFECTETWTQKIYINDCLVETRKLVFTIQNNENGCTGSATRQ